MIRAGRGVGIRDYNVLPMRHDTLFFALYLMVIAALLIKDAPRPVATEDKAAVAAAEKAPIIKNEKASPAVPQADDSSKRSRRRIDPDFLALHAASPWKLF